MTNPPKKKGTAAETAVVRWLRDNGFPWADRMPLKGNRDHGDILLCLGVIAEVKSVAKGATGQPPRGLLETWLQQTDVEAEHANADFGILIVKRAGTTNPADWWCYLRLGESLRLADAPVTVPDPTPPVCYTLASVVALLRAAGFGTAPEGETL